MNQIATPPAHRPDRIPSIAATLDLSDDNQRRLNETIRRMHTGRSATFKRMHDIRRDGSALVELAEWRQGGFAVVRWTWTTDTIALTWHDCPTRRDAEDYFFTGRPPEWHHHAFSPRCTDEVRGRFDALDGEDGICVVDAGTRQIVAYAETRDEAVEIAEALAAEWRPRTLKRRGWAL